MGRVWSVDAVAKNASTSFYGNIVALAESPLTGGAALRRHRRRPDPGHRGRRRRPGGRSSTFPGVPDDSYVSRVVASQHDADTRLRRVRQPQEGRLQAVPARRARTAAAPGRRSPATCPSAARSTRSPRTTSTRTCSSPAPSSASSSRSDGGDDVGPAQGRPADDRRCATSRSRSARTTSCSPRSAAASTSSTTTRRCARVDDGDARAGGDAASRCATALDVHPGGPARRRASKAFQGDALLHRAQPAVRRGLHLLPEGRAQDAARSAPGRGEGDRRRRASDAPYPIVGRRCAPRIARRSPAILLTVTDEDGQRRAAPHRPGDGGLPPRRVGPALPGRRPDRASTPRRATTRGTGCPPGRWPRRARYTVSLAKRVDGVRHAARRAADVRGGAARRRASLPPADRSGAARVPAEDRAAAARGARRRRRPPARRRRGIDHLKKALVDTPAADPKLADELRAIEARLKDLQVALDRRSTRAEPERADAAVDRGPRAAGRGRATGTRPRRRPRRTARLRHRGGSSSRRCWRSCARSSTSDLQAARGRRPRRRARRGRRAACRTGSRSSERARGPAPTGAGPRPRGRARRRA